MGDEYYGYQDAPVSSYLAGITDDYAPETPGAAQPYTPTDWNSKTPEDMWLMVRKESDERAYAQAEMWRRTSALLQATRENLQRHTDALNAKWTSPAGQIFMAKTGAALHSIDEWKKVADDNAQGLEQIAKTIKDTQTEVKALWEEYQAKQASEAKKVAEDKKELQASDFVDWLPFVDGNNGKSPSDVRDEYKQRFIDKVKPMAETYIDVYISNISRAGRYKGPTNAIMASPEVQVPRPSAPRPPGAAPGAPRGGAPTRPTTPDSTAPGAPPVDPNLGAAPTAPPPGVSLAGAAVAPSAPPAAMPPATPPVAGPAPSLPPVGYTPPGALPGRPTLPGAGKPALPGNGRGPAPTKPTLPGGRGTAPGKPTLPGGRGGNPSKPTLPGGRGMAPAKPTLPGGGRGPAPSKPSVPGGGRGAAPGKPTLPGSRSTAARPGMPQTGTGARGPQSPSLGGKQAAGRPGSPQVGGNRSAAGQPGAGRPGAPQLGGRPGQPGVGQPGGRGMPGAPGPAARDTTRPSLGGGRGLEAGRAAPGHGPQPALGGRNGGVSVPRPRDQRRPEDEDGEWAYGDDEELFTVESDAVSSLETPAEHRPQEQGRILGQN